MELVQEVRTFQIVPDITKTGKSGMSTRSRRSRRSNSSYCTPYDMHIH